MLSSFEAYQMLVTQAGIKMQYDQFNVWWVSEGRSTITKVLSNWMDRGGMLKNQERFKAAKKWWGSKRAGSIKDSLTATIIKKSFRYGKKSRYQTTRKNLKEGRGTRAQWDWAKDKLRNEKPADEKDKDNENVTQAELFSGLSPSVIAAIIAIAIGVTGAVLFAGGDYGELDDDLVSYAAGIFISGGGSGRTII